MQTIPFRPLLDYAAAKQMCIAAGCNARFLDSREIIMIVPPDRRAWSMIEKDIIMQLYSFEDDPTVPARVKPLLDMADLSDHLGEPALRAHFDRKWAQWHITLPHAQIVERVRHMAVTHPLTYKAAVRLCAEFFNNNPQLVTTDEYHGRIVLAHSRTRYGLVDGITFRMVPGDPPIQLDSMADLADALCRHWAPGLNLRELLRPPPPRIFDPSRREDVFARMGRVERARTLEFAEAAEICRAFFNDDPRYIDTTRGVRLMGPAATLERELRLHFQGHAWAFRTAWQLEEALRLVWLDGVGPDYLATVGAILKQRDIADELVDDEDAEAIRSVDGPPD